MPLERKGRVGKTCFPQCEGAGDQAQQEQVRNPLEMQGQGWENLFPIV